MIAPLHLFVVVVALVPILQAGPPGFVMWSAFELVQRDAALSASRQTRAGAHLHRRLMEWTDAFRTLKLIHALRDQGLHSVPLDVDEAGSEPLVILARFTGGSVQGDK